MRLFAERARVVLSQNLVVDFVDSGDYSGASLLPTLSNHIDAGTIVDSYMLHADFVTIDANNGIVLRGSLRFDSEILGLLISDSRSINNSLDNSDAILGIASTLYPTGDATRGLGSSQDFLRLSPDRRTLEVSLDIPVSFSVDQIRIVTRSVASVPEPTSICVWVVSLLALLTNRRRLCSM